MGLEFKTILGHKVYTKERKHALTINIAVPGEPVSYDIVIPNRFRDVAGDIINAVIKEKKEEANG